MKVTSIIENTSSKGLPVEHGLSLYIEKDDGQKIFFELVLGKKEGVFYPHISLVQYPSTIITDIDLLKASMRVEKIFIMKSERINGELIYSEIQ